MVEQVTNNNSPLPPRSTVYILYIQHGVFDKETMIV
jgi:hypothetical protein